MIYDKDTLFGIINSIIDRQVKFLIPREGQVKDLNDPEKLGRVLIQVPSLGWDTNNKAAWCHGTDKNLLSTVKKDDYVIIQFVDGNRDFPICIGKSNRIKGMIPKNYDGKPTTHILFESPADKIMMKYDEEADLLQIGKKDYRSSSRVDDTTTSSSSEDSAYWSFWSGFLAVFQAWVPVPNDGGAALKTALTTFFGGNPTPTKQDGKITSGSSQVEVGDK